MTDIHSNRFWRNVITKLKGEDDMTEHDAMKQMEDAINELNDETNRQAEPKPQDKTVGSLVNESRHIRVAPQGLDAGRLMELARDRLQFARDKLNDIRRTHAMKAFEIDSQYQRRLQEAVRERDHALATLDEQSNAEAKPAKDMIDLVERMLG